MSTNNPVQTDPGSAVGGVAQPGNVKLEVQSLEGAGSADSAQFRAALERYMSGNGGAAPSRPGSVSLGEKVAGRVTNLAGDIKKDQQYVSKLLEQATRTGDSMHLMKAVMALHDYQIRVQTISKTVSKSTQAFEQLTKLQ